MNPVTNLAAFLVVAVLAAVVALGGPAGRADQQAADTIVPAASIGDVGNVPLAQENTAENSAPSAKPRGGYFPSLIPSMVIVVAVLLVGAMVAMAHSKTGQQFLLKRF